MHRLRTHRWHVVLVVGLAASSQTISVQGTERTFHLYRPAGLPVAAPLVVMLHGGCGQPDQDNVDDVGFLTQMVTAIEHETTVDTTRIYVTGISNGGIMSYTLACRTAIFAAIGPDSATELGDCPSPTPTSVIHIHGTADSRIRYDGGTGSGAAHIDGPAVPRSREVAHRGRLRDTVAEHHRCRNDVDRWGSATERSADADLAVDDVDRNRRQWRWRWAL